MARLFHVRRKNKTVLDVLSVVAVIVMGLGQEGRRPWQRSGPDHVRTGAPRSDGTYILVFADETMSELLPDVYV